MVSKNHFWGRSMNAIKKYRMTSYQVKEYFWVLFCTCTFSFWYT